MKKIISVRAIKCDKNYEIECDLEHICIDNGLLLISTKADCEYLNLMYNTGLHHNQKCIKTVKYVSKFAAYNKNNNEREMVNK